MYSRTYNSCINLDEGDHHFVVRHRQPSRPPSCCCAVAAACVSQLFFGSTATARLRKKTVDVNALRENCVGNQWPHIHKEDYFHVTTKADQFPPLRDLKADPVNSLNQWHFIIFLQLIAFQIVVGRLKARLFRLILLLLVAPLKRRLYFLYNDFFVNLSFTLSFTFPEKL